MQKRLIALFFVTLFAVMFPNFVSAKRLLPRAAAKAASASGTKTSSSTKGVTAKVQFRGDRRAIVATFTNLGIATSVSYTLTYESGGTMQGAGGSILSGAPEPVSRELLFGSCSNGICRYDSNITNAKLIVTSNLINGKKVSKTFKLKV